MTARGALKQSRGGATPRRPGCSLEWGQIDLTDGKTIRQNGSALLYRKVRSVDQDLFTPKASAKRKINSMNEFLAEIGRAPLSKESEEEIRAFYRKSYEERPNIEVEE